MADFPTMAAETTSNLSTLLEETEQTQTSLQEAKAEITRVRQQVEEAWSGLSDRAQSLLERVNAGKNELSAKVESSTQVIAQLKQKIDTVQQELTQELEETKTAIAATDDKLNELIPELEESLNDTESALNSLQEKEIGVELEQAATSTGQKISEVNDELQTFQTEIEQQTETFQDYVSEQCIPTITDSTTALGDRLDDVIEHFTDQMQAVGDNVEEAMPELIERVSDNQDKLFEQLNEVTQQLEELMGKLSSAVEMASSSVLDASNTVVDGIDLTSTNCQKAIDLLSQARESLEVI